MIKKIMEETVEVLSEKDPDILNLYLENDLK